MIIVLDDHHHNDYYHFLLGYGTLIIVVQHKWIGGTRFT
jgi:hypothetical protein